MFRIASVLGGKEDDMICEENECSVNDMRWKSIRNWRGRS